MKLTSIFKQKGPAEGSKDVQMIFDGGDAIVVYHIYQRAWYACIDVIDCKRGISRTELLNTIAKEIHKQEPDIICLNYVIKSKYRKTFEDAGWIYRPGSYGCREILEENGHLLYTKDLPAVFRDKDGNKLQIGDKISFNIYENNWCPGEITGFNHYQGSVNFTYEQVAGKPIKTYIAYNPKGNVRIQKKEA